MCLTPCLRGGPGAHPPSPGHFCSFDSCLPAQLEAAPCPSAVPAGWRGGAKLHGQSGRWFLPAGGRDHHKSLPEEGSAAQSSQQSLCCCDVLPTGQRLWAKGTGWGLCVCSGKWLCNNSFCSAQAMSAFAPAGIPPVWETGSVEVMTALSLHYHGGCTGQLSVLLWSIFSTLGVLQQVSVTGAVHQPGESFPAPRAAGAGCSPACEAASTGRSLFVERLSKALLPFPRKRSFITEVFS